MTPSGYPDEEELQTIREWEDDYAALLEYVRARWKYARFFCVEDGTYKLSTAGWSGNESLIRALKENSVFWGLCWKASRRGGHHEFDLKHTAS